MFLILKNFYCCTKMNSINLNENVCRICLEYNAILNWNDEVLQFYGISYKDCYYKYTQLNESDSDCFPQNLCKICADDLKNAHFLVDKALGSFNILQSALTDQKLNISYTKIEICNDLSTLKNDNYTTYESYSIPTTEINNIADDEAQVEYLSFSSDDEVVEVGINEITENVTIEPVQFIDMYNIESSDENVMEQKLLESCDDELPALSADIKEVKTNNQSQTSQQQRNKSCDLKVRNRNTKKIGKRKTYESESSLDPSLSESSYIKKSTAGSRSEQRDKKKRYILICQYCSLKVNGIHHLKKHEATHCENRERNQTCPQCGIKLYTKLALTEHIKIHKENRQKQHKCEFCEKAFFNKGALNVHRRIHLGLMVKCRICAKEYYRQIDLDKHLLTHSASPLERNVGKVKYTIQCQYCEKSVRTVRWKEHKAAHLGQPEVKCKLCDKNFFSRRRCVKHLQRLHRKTRDEYEGLIHYYVAHNTRMSHLKMVQEGKVQPLIE